MTLEKLLLFFLHEVKSGYFSAHNQSLFLRTQFWQSSSVRPTTLQTYTQLAKKKTATFPEMNVLFAIVEAVSILALIIIAARYILNPLLNMLVRFGSPEIFTATALLLVLGSAQAMEWIGLSMAMGAFIAGLLLADSSHRHEIITEVKPFRGLLLGLFFLSMGMSLHMSLLLETPILFAVAVAGLLTVKFVTLWPLARLFGVSVNISVSVALLLAQSGEFALVLFALADGMGLLEEQIFQQLLLVVALRMLATPALEYFAYKNFLATRKAITPG